MLVNINDVKAGDEIMFKDCTTGLMLDDLKGIRRMVERQLLYDPTQIETVSVYVDEIAQVKREGHWAPIGITPTQKRQIDNVRGMPTLF